MNSAFSETSAKRPIIRLRPKHGGRFFAGAPWVYNNEIVLDRRTKALAAGAIATLRDADRQDLATVAFHPSSKIAVRKLDADPNAEIDADWFEQKIRAALKWREALYDAPFYRLIHAEADGLPGVVIDRFGDAVAVQPNAAWAEARRRALLAALDRVLAPSIVVWNGGSRARALEGLPQELRVMKGALDGPIETPMNGATYMADLAGGQKTGLFFDQRETQRFAASLAKDASVLDVFCHVGGFGLAALAAGARSAELIDGSASALELAQEGARRMGVSDKLKTTRADAFDAMRALIEEEKRFDVVICDPPAFAPNKSALEAGLRAYAKTARLGLNLVAPGGVFVLCSCSHAVDAAALGEIAGKVMAKARRNGRLLRQGGAGPDHPLHPQLAESGYLKTLIYALD